MLPQLSASEPASWLHPLSDDDFLARAAELNFIPEEALGNPELLSVLLPVLRADLELNERYTHQWAEEPPLLMPILALGGSEDSITAEMLRGWSEHSACTPQAERWRIQRS